MSLLIDERCVLVQPSLVRALGHMEDAAILQHLHYWLPHAREIMDGEKWVYKTADEWADETGLSTHQVYRCMARLEKVGVVVSCRPEAGKWDQRKWYRIDYSHDVLTAKSNSQNCEMEVADLPDRDSKSANSSSSQRTTESTEEETSADADVDDEPREDVERLCLLLADRIEANGSKRPNVTKRWRDACRRLIDLDGRTERQVQNMIEWCQGNEFWRGNILSMPKLRDKYDQMRLQAERDWKKTRNEPRGNEAIREYMVGKGLAGAQ